MRVFQSKKGSAFGIAMLSLLLAFIVGSPAFGETPMPGGTLRLAAPYGSALKSLDPHVTYRSQDLVVSKAFHRALYTWDSGQNAPALDLAESVTQDDSGKVFTYKLLKNAYFHNGRKMTADDVIWSYTRVMDPTKGYPGATMIGTVEGAQAYAKGEAKTISGLKKIDDFTLQIAFADYVDPGMLLSEAITAVLPREEVEMESFLLHPVGLGPFKFVEHVEGSRIVGEKFDKYYKPGKPYADRVEFTITDDYSVLDMAFRAGEIDATVLNSNAYPAYKMDPELSKGLIEVPELFTRHMGFNTEKKPFDDKRVRQAFNYAVDRDIIIKKLLKDKAFKATGWLPSTSIAFDKNLKPYPYDPAKAKELLKEAGYPDGFEFEATLKDSTDSLGVFEAMLPYLEKVGLRGKAKVVEAGVLMDAMNTGEADVWFRSTGTGPDPLKALRCFDSRIPRTGGNPFAYKDAAFDAMLDEIAGTRDQAKRIELLKKADAYILDAAPVWFNNYNKAVVATQPWIHNVDANVTEAAILEVDSMWLDKNSPSRK